MTIDRVNCGDSLSAASQNELIDQVNALSCPGAADRAQYGTAGITFQGPPPTRLALFELTSAMSYPNLDGAASGYFNCDPTPSAQAQMVWLHQYQAADIDANGNPIGSYSGINNSPVVSIWHPRAPRNPDGYAYGPPAFAQGDRVYCHWNRQSGRWEIVSDNPSWFIAYAKVQTGFVNFTTSSGYTVNATAVSVVACDADGSNESGDAFNLPLPGLGATTGNPPVRSPALFPGDVVTFGLDQTGQGVILNFGAYIDDAGGTIKAFGPGLPRGWSVCDGTNNTPDLRAAFIMGADPVNAKGGGAYPPGNTGGYIWHGPTENNHADHPTPKWDVTLTAIRVTDAAGNTQVAQPWDYDVNCNGQNWSHFSAAAGDGDCDNRPPFYAMQYIMRTS